VKEKPGIEDRELKKIDAEPVPEHFLSEDAVFAVLNPQFSIILSVLEA